MYVTEDCTLTVRGNFPPIPQTKDLKTGWNLIAAPTDTEIDVSEALYRVTYDAIKAYNGTTYDDATTMQSGKAYWVHVPNPQTWLIPIPNKETTYLYDGDGGRVMRTEPTTQPSPQGGEGTGEGLLSRATVYIGSAYELSGTQGQPADKITKHIFMGSTRICSIETEEEVEHTYYYHADHLGSSNVITDETGDIASIIEYTPYGLTAKTGGAYNTDKRFTGKTYDAGSALYYYGARYYDPQLGRFITADSVIAYPNDPQSFSRYTYCRNNPVIYTDPSGNFWWFVAMVIGAIVGAVAGGVSAAQNGGNIALGALVGGVIGMIVGAYTYAAGGALVAIMGGVEGITMFGSALVGASVGAIGGAASGITVGFKGGKGTASDIFSAVGSGAAWGAATGAVTGALSSSQFWNGISSGDWRTTEEISANLAQWQSTVDAYYAEYGVLGTLEANEGMTSSIIQFNTDQSTAISAELFRKPGFPYIEGSALNHSFTGGPYRGNSRTPFSIVSVPAKIIGFFTIKALAITAGVLAGLISRKPRKVGLPVYEWVDFTLNAYFFDRGTFPINKTYGIFDLGSAGAY